jgi:hypothetical protein
VSVPYIIGSGKYQQAKGVSHEPPVCLSTEQPHTRNRAYDHSRRYNSGSRKGAEAFSLVPLDQQLPFLDRQE